MQYRADRLALKGERGGKIAKFFVYVCGRQKVRFSSNHGGVYS
jgi:hypothetical protein